MPHPASLRRKRRPFFAGRKENRSRNGRKRTSPSVCAGATGGRDGPGNTDNDKTAKACLTERSTCCRPRSATGRCPISDETAPWDVLPAANRAVMDSLDYFIVENERTARRFLSRAGIGKPIDGLRIAELNEHTTPEQVAELLAPVLGGADAGVLSEAGLPGVADPGADLTALAHRHGIRVTPLVGPSSILLALMASGLNGQSFAFNGYLPVKHPERGQAIRRLEQRARTEGQSQLFIETPYRNLRLFDELTSLCADDTLLTVAADILQPDELIHTAPVRQWRGHAPDIHKRPAIFIVGTQAPPEKRGIGAPDRKERSARQRSR